MTESSLILLEISSLEREEEESEGKKEEFRERSLISKSAVLVVYKKRKSRDMNRPKTANHDDLSPSFSPKSKKREK